MEDFERVKDELNLETVITDETGFRMKGKHLEQCPFCGGHNCFSIVPGGGGFRCFQCEAKGDVFNFLQQYHNLDEHGSLVKAAELAGVKLKSKSDNPRTVVMDLKQRIFQAAAIYYFSEMEKRLPCDYMCKKRGHDPKVIKEMNIGWSTGMLHKELSRQFNIDDLVQTSLVKEIKDDEGNVTGYRDFFPKGLAIFPHMVNKKVGHFTFKDPTKKLSEYQLPNIVRDRGWLFLNQDCLKSKEIILVEGEHDLLSVMDSGFNNVIALIGQISDAQLKALGSKMKGKRLYLWVDKDEQGSNYIRKITNRLRGEDYDVRIIAHPGETKDADEYIQAIEGDKRTEVKKLIESAESYLSWEITRISEIETLDEKLKQLKAHNIFSRVSIMVEVEREIYVDRILKLGFSKKAIEHQLDNNQELRERLGTYFTEIPEKEWNPLQIARIIFLYFNEFGRFFHNGKDKAFLLYHHKIMPVNDNMEFSALLMKYTGLLVNRSPGPQVWRALELMAYNEGLFIDMASWIHFNRVTDTIYINLNSPGNGIIKVTPGNIEEIENGMNNEGVLLNSSLKIMPFTYLPDSDVREGLSLLKELVIDNLTCDLEQRHLIICWLISAFLMDFAPSMALMKFSGASSSGKTTAAKLITLLLYGTEQILDTTGAAAFSVASQNPLLVIDNLEQENITKQIGQFLLLTTNKGSKEKRKSGTETETTQETPKSLVCITAIEPFTRAEHINRTYDIDFSHKYHSDDFIEDEVNASILKNRDLILSSILKLISKDVLPNLKERRDNLTVLKMAYSKHTKSRTNEYLALLMLILSKILPHCPVYGKGDFLAGSEQSKNIWDRWLTYQDEKAKETETGTNMIIKLLGGIEKHFLLKFRAMNENDYHKTALFRDLEHLADKHDKLKMLEDGELNLTAFLSREERIKTEESSYDQAFMYITATSAELVDALDSYCKMKSLRNPYTSAQMFSARLGNDIKVLNAAGWSLMTKPEREGPYFKKIRGDRYFQLRKRVVR